MIISISSDAEADLAEGYWFYERQSPGLGDYFCSCLIADIDSLSYYGGIKQPLFCKSRYEQAGHLAFMFR